MPDSMIVTRRIGISGPAGSCDRTGAYYRASEPRRQRPDCPKPPAGSGIEKKEGNALLFLKDRRCYLRLAFFFAFLRVTFFFVTFFLATRFFPTFFFAVFFFEEAFFVCFFAAATACSSIGIGGLPCK